MADVNLILLGFRIVHPICCALKYKIHETALSAGRALVSQLLASFSLYRMMPEDSRTLFLNRRAGLQDSDIYFDDSAAL